MKSNRKRIPWQHWPPYGRARARSSFVIGAELWRFHSLDADRSASPVAAVPIASIDVELAWSGFPCAGQISSMPSADIQSLSPNDLPDSSVAPQKPQDLRARDHEQLWT